MEGLGERSGAGGAQRGVSGQHDQRRAERRWPELPCCPAPLRNPRVSSVLVPHFTPAVPRLREATGPLQMDAILSCGAQDLEDYYKLLGCDELSTVRALATAPQLSDNSSVLVCLQRGSEVLYLYGQHPLKRVVTLLPGPCKAQFSDPYPDGKILG